MAIPMQSKHWFWPVSLVLLVGYVIGGIAPVGVHYFGWFGSSWPEGFKTVLFSFLIGLLGANTQLSIHFSRDVNAVMSGKDNTLPSCFEFFGYML
jgi:RsiW-degrading membrane proteinase PrsW (M82 family)